MIQKNEATQTAEMTPREIVSELDKYIIGQHMAKRSVASSTFLRSKPKIIRTRFSFPKVGALLRIDEWLRCRIVSTP